MKNFFSHPQSSVLYPLCTLLCLLLPPSSFGQGSLTPSGPPAPTMKTLDQVEARIPIGSLPFTITAPGSYYLTRDLTLSGGGNGIIVESGSVTIDLMGFVLRRGFGVPGTASGIFAADSIQNVTVRNGFVSGWSVGIDLRGNNGRVERVTASFNGGAGITCGPSSILMHCIVANNGGAGLGAGAASVVSQSTARDNSGDGITVGGGSTIQACSSYSNTFNNILALGGGCLIAKNTVAEGNFDGIRVVGDGSAVLDNTCRTNAQNGIYVDGNDNRVEGNTSSRNGTGIRIVKGFNLIIKNSAASNPAPDASGGASNYNIIIGNYVGKIVQPTPVVAGNPNPGLGTTDPWANFSF